MNTNCRCGHQWPAALQRKNDSTSDNHGLCIHSGTSSYCGVERVYSHKFLQFPVPCSDICRNEWSMNGILPFSSLIGVHSRRSTEGWLQALSSNYHIYSWQRDVPRCGLEIPLSATFVLELLKAGEILPFCWWPSQANGPQTVGGTLFWPPQVINSDTERVCGEAERPSWLRIST